MATFPEGFTAPPVALVEDGVLHLGRWKGPLARTNLIDLPYRGLPRALRWWRLKEWQAVQVATPTLFMNVALVDTKLVTMVQIKAYDRARAVKHLHERKLRPRALRLTDQLIDSRAAYADRTSQLAFTNQLAHGRVDVDLDVAAHGGGPAMRGHFTLATDAGAAQVVNLPFVHGSVYSHKGLFPVTGELSIDGVHHDLDGAVATLDDHKAYYPYTMQYDWVTSLWRGADGVARGFNLTRNQCVEPERWNENCVWVGDQVASLPAVTVTRERERAPGERWLVRDRAGQVDLVFEPTVPGDVRLNLGVIESRYRGPFGRCQGRLAPPGLDPIEVDDRFGMGEDFWLRG
ncbi:MAG: DUF2804 family protein [Myxococcales bacterium]|nr:DUF2804 family protein [Myxococcales bacterium]